MHAILRASVVGPAIFVAAYYGAPTAPCVAEQPPADPPGVSSPTTGGGWRKLVGAAQEKRDASRQEVAPAVTEFKAAKQALQDLERPKIDRKAPSPEVLDDARGRFEQARAGLARKTLALTAAENELRSVERQASRAAAAEAAPTSTQPLPNPVGTAIADLAYGVSPTYEHLLKLRQTLRGFDDRGGPLMPESGERLFTVPPAVDPFTRQTQAYQDQYDSDRIAAQTAAEIAAMQAKTTAAAGTPISATPVPDPKGTNIVPEPARVPIVGPARKVDAISGTTWTNPSADETFTFDSDGGFASSDDYGGWRKVSSSWRQIGQTVEAEVTLMNPKGDFQVRRNYAFTLQGDRMRAEWTRTWIPGGNYSSYSRTPSRMEPFEVRR